jgi:hypothetical protein
MILYSYNDFLFETEKEKEFFFVSPDKSSIVSEGDKITYKKEGSEHNGKNGIFTGIREDGKYRITLEDGKKLAVDGKNVSKFDVAKDIATASAPATEVNVKADSVASDNKYKLVLSKKFRSLLKDIKSPLSDALIGAEEKESPSSISFLDYIEDKEKTDTLTFLPVNRFLRNADWVSGSSEVWETKQRQEMKVGKIVNTLFPDTFKQTQIEAFVNEFKAQIGKSFSNLRLVEGEEIRYYYLADHYETQNKGSINSSCMRGKAAQKFFDIYCNNPRSNSSISPNTGWCNLLILMSDTDPKKIKGRALVWFNLRKPTGKVYMDRIYTVNDADQKMYIDYAKKQGWLYKRVQGMGDASYIDPDGKAVYSSVAVQLKPVKYDYYPSIDTLPYYTPSTGRLGSNAGNYIQGHPRYVCNSTSGSASKLDK